MGINRRFVDLHMHSTASDGTTPPEKLIEVARAETALALSEGWISEEPQEYIMALTDHDTLAGIPALEKAAREFENVRIIPGVEISSDYQGHEIHILGYKVDSENSDLQSGLEYYRGERQRRNRPGEPTAPAGIEFHAHFLPAGGAGDHPLVTKGQHALKKRFEVQRMFTRQRSALLFAVLWRPLRQSRGDRHAG